MDWGFRIAERSKSEIRLPKSEMGVVLLTVSMQAVKAALANPVEALKYE
ncbi:MAG: hypothetical protein ACE5HS_04765 [bacterium]